MKTKLLTICLLLFTSQVFAESISKYKYTFEEDEFTGVVKQNLMVNYYAAPKSTAPSKLNLNEHGIKIHKTHESIMMFSVILMYWYTPKDKDISLTLMVTPYTKNWNTLNVGAGNADVLLDGKPSEIHKYKQANNVRDNGVQESFYFFYNGKENVKKFISSKIFKARVMPVVFSLDIQKMGLNRLKSFHD